MLNDDQLTFLETVITKLDTFKVGEPSLGEI